MLKRYVVAGALVGQVQVVRLCRILCGKRVNLLDNGQDAELLALLTNAEHRLVHVRLLFLQSYGTRYLEVGEAVALGLAQQVGANVPTLPFHLLVNVDDVLELLQEPAVNLRQLMDVLNGVLRQVHGLRNDEDALVGRLTQRRINIGNLQFLVLHETMHPLPYHAQTFLYGFLEGTADGHHLTHRLHAGAQLLVHATELREVPARNLTYYVVQSRLKEGAGGLGHAVVQFKQSVAHAQLGSDEGQRITCGFRCEGRRTAESSVDLNDTIILAPRVEGILHVTLADDADVAYNLDGQRTQLVVVGVAQRLTGCHDDALTRMDAQRVEVLHVTHGDAVVIAVTHNLVLYLLPALERLLHEHLWREREGFFCQTVQLFLIVAEARTQSAQRIGGTQDDGIAQVGSCLTCCVDVVAGMTLDGLHVYLVQFLHEQLTVFRIHDGLHGSTQHLDAVLLQHAALVELHATVQRRLSAERQEDAVGTFLLNDPFHEVRLHRQEINLVCHALRGLYRSNIRIDEYRLHALFTKCLECLTAGVVELTGFTYFECAATQQQHLVDCIVFHFLACYYNALIKRSNINSVSVGPEQASGWNCDENQGFVRWQMPSFEPSFRFTNNSRQSAPSVEASTA